MQDQSRNSTGQHQKWSESVGCPTVISSSVCLCGCVCVRGVCVSVCMCVYMYVCGWL